MCRINSPGHSFEVDGIYYDIYSDEAIVTYKGSNYDSYNDEYSGSVNIPSTVTYNAKTYSVTAIGYNAFRGCSGLISVTIPNSVTHIDQYAFYACTGLASVELPNSVTEINGSAFSSCSSLTSVTIPSSVKSTGRYAFYNCNGLTSVTCSAVRPPATTSNCFSNSIYNTATLYVPKESLTLYWVSDGWKKFITIEGITEDAGAGDVNGDGEVNIADINAIVNIILSSQ